MTIELPADSKDHIIPYCADQRHPADTLFFIAEEDWRLKESHCFDGIDQTMLSEDHVEAMDTPSSKEHLGKVRGKTTWPRYQLPAFAFEPPADKQKSSAKGHETMSQWLHVGLSFHRRAQKPKSEKFATASSHIVDLVKLCTEAHRAGAEDLLWISRLPKKASE